MTARINKAVEKNKAAADATVGAVGDDTVAVDAVTVEIMESRVPIPVAVPTVNLMAPTLPSGATSPPRNRTNSPQFPRLPTGRKKAIYAERAEEKACTGPSSGTRSQTATPTPTTQAGTKPTTGRLQQLVSSFTSPSCPIILSDHPASHSSMGRCDDGNDESIASPAVAKAAVVKGIGLMTAIAFIKIQVALRDSETTASFTFSRTFHVPRLVLQLSAGQIAVLNVTSLVADEETACEDLLVGLPCCVICVLTRAHFLSRHGAVLMELTARLSQITRAMVAPDALLVLFLLVSIKISQPSRKKRHLNWTPTDHVRITSTRNNIWTPFHIHSS